MLAKITAGALMIALTVVSFNGYATSDANTKLIVSIGNSKNPKKADTTHIESYPSSSIPSNINVSTSQQTPIMMLAALYHLVKYRNMPRVIEPTTPIST